MEEVLISQASVTADEILVQLRTDARFAELRDAKRFLFEKLLRSEYFSHSLLEINQRTSIALATVNGVFQKGKIPEEPWSQYVLRFRACVERALYYQALQEGPASTVHTLALGGYTFQLPGRVENFSGMKDVSQLLCVLVLLEDIISVLNVALRFKDRATRSRRRSHISKADLINDCRMNLNKPLELKNRSFKDFCNGWGFDFPISACSMVRMIPALARQKDIRLIHHLFVVAQRDLQQMTGRIMEGKEAGA